MNRLFARRGYRLAIETRRDGLRMIRILVPHLHSSILAAYVRSGARYEPVRLSGISHFLEHILFKGSTRYPTPLALARATEEIGASLEAETHFEYTTYWLHPDPAALPEAVRILGDVLVRPLFRPADIALERRVILQECRDHREEVESDRHLTRLLWPEGEALLHPLGGAREVRSMRREDLELWHRRTYRPSETVLVAVSPRDDGRRAARAGSASRSGLAEALRAWPAFPAAAPAPSGRTGPVARGPVLRFRRGDPGRLEIRIFYPAPSYSDPRDVALWVLGEILGGGPTSRFFLDLREERGLAYETVTSYLLFRGMGFLECRASVRPEDGPEALERILACAKDLARTGPAPDELERFRRLVATRMEGNLDRPEELAGWFGLRSLLVPERLEFLDEEAERVARVTPREVRDLARRVLDPRRRLGLVLGRPRPRVQSRMEKIWEGSRSGRIS